jgi:1-deoxy-D-xylulose-5-phosphate synthase
MEKVLDQIQTSQDVKKLDPEELERLCREIREEIISVVSKNGGHLASNLGVVELTTALH